MTSLAGAALVVPAPAWAGSDAAHHAGLLLWIGAILIAARVGSLVARFGQPAVLGELLAGIVLGNLALVGWTGAATVATDPVVVFLAELGVVVLLFQIGLESNVQQMLAVGGRAMAVAVVGVVVPFVLGTPMPRGSGSQAERSARAVALKMVSMM